MNRDLQEFEARRQRMVQDQLVGRGITDLRVLEAMRALPRERFLPPGQEGSAYDDRPLSIGCEATLSQPYIVAFMTEKLALKGGERVLEIGTGSGYQAAVLAKLVREVWSIEVEETLAVRAGDTLRGLGIGNVHIRAGDGMNGWPEQAPFDRIIVTCALEYCPADLKEQVNAGGWILAPIGGCFRQDLVQYVRTLKGLKEVTLLPVMFVTAKKRP